MEFYGRQWNQGRAWLCRLVGKTLHINASFPMLKVMSCLKCMMWSNGYLIPSYIVNFGNMKPLSDSQLMIWGVEWHREHVIQPSVDRIKQGSRYWYSHLRLVDLDMPLGFLTCTTIPPRLVLEVSVKLASHQENATLCYTFFSLMPEWCLGLRSTTFDELAKASPRIVLSNYHRRTLCPRGKMPQQFVVRLFVGFEYADFERSPLLRFELTTLCSLLLVVLFGRAESASAAHFLISVSPFFRARQNSLCYPQLMIGFWRVLTSLVGSHKRCECWCCDNWMHACLVLAQSDGLLPCTKGCSDKWFKHAPPKFKLESNGSESNFLNGYVCVPFSCFWRGFYRTYDTIVIAWIVHLCLSCANDCHRCRYYALIRQSTPLSQCGLGNYTK